MKYLLSIGFLTLLIACGETHIKSVDDETMNKVSEDKAAIDLKSEQTDLLGTWRGCSVGTEPGQSIRHEYAFASDGQVSMRQNIFDNSTCDETSAEFRSESTKGSYKIVATDDKPGFLLKFGLDGSINLESEYQLAGSGPSKFPNVFQLDDKGARLKLQDKDKFLTLAKIPPGESEALRQKAEKKVFDLAQALLKRKGIWRSDCLENKQFDLQFSLSNKTIGYTQAEKSFNEEGCKTPKDAQAAEQKYTMILEAVTDLDQNAIQVNLTKADEKKPTKVSLLINLDTFDSFVLNKVSYNFIAAGAE